MSKKYAKIRVKEFIHKFEMKDENIKIKDKWYIPEYQRDLVWDKKKQVSFINFLLKDFSNGEDCTEFRLGFINGNQNVQVIDGQQRLTSIKLYINDNFEVNKMFFSQLSLKEQNKIMDYQIECFQYNNLTESRAIEIYQKSNSGKPLCNEAFMKARLIAAHNDIYSFFLKVSKIEKNRFILPTESRKEKESTFYKLWAYTKVSDKQMAKLNLKAIESEMVNCKEINKIEKDFNNTLTIHHKLWIESDNKTKISGKALIFTALVKKHNIALNSKETILNLEKIKQNIININSSNVSGVAYRNLMVTEVLAGFKKYKLVS